MPGPWAVPSADAGVPDGPAGGQRMTSKGRSVRGLLPVVFLALLPGAEGAAPPVSGRLGPARLDRLRGVARRKLEAMRAGRFALALRSATEFADLRARWQGARHWEVMDAR